MQIFKRIAKSVAVIMLSGATLASAQNMVIEAGTRLSMITLTSVDLAQSPDGIVLFKPLPSDQRAGLSESIPNYCVLSALASQQPGTGNYYLEPVRMMCITEDRRILEVTEPAADILLADKAVDCSDGSEHCVTSRIDAEQPAELIIHEQLILTQQKRTIPTS